jgi:hypothetical protein
MHDRANHVSLAVAALPPGQRPRLGAEGSPPDVETVAPDGRPSAPGPAPARRHVHADALLAETIAWYEALPPDVQPRTLVATYPRIANALCAASRDRQSFDNCVGALLTDGRRERAGFPAGVLRDLFTLRAHIHALHADGFGASQAPVGR